MNRVLSLESFRHNDVVSFVNWKQIGHFRVHLGLHFKARLSAKSLLWKSVFIHIEIRTNYHNKTFALRLALKERLRGTRKWPISCMSRLGYSQNERIMLNTMRKQQVKDLKFIRASSFPESSLVKMTRGNSHRKLNKKSHLKDSKFDSFVINNNKMTLKTSADNYIQVPPHKTWPLALRDVCPRVGLLVC